MVAAEQITADDEKKLRRCLGHLYVTRDLDDEWPVADHEFHNQILRIANNPITGRILDALHAAIRQTVSGVRTLHHPADTMASFKRHEAIFHALISRDPDAARLAMRAHFDAVDLAINNLAGAVEKS